MKKVIEYSRCQLLIEYYRCQILIEYSRCQILIEYSRCQILIEYSRSCSTGKHENVCYCDPACRKRRLNGPSRSQVCALALGDSAWGCRRTVVQRGSSRVRTISAIIIRRTAYE